MDVMPSRQVHFSATLWQLSVVAGLALGALVNWWLVDLKQGDTPSHYALGDAWCYIAAGPVR